MRKQRERKHIQHFWPPTLGLELEPKPKPKKALGLSFRSSLIAQSHPLREKLMAILMHNLAGIRSLMPLLGSASTSKPPKTPKDKGPRRGTCAGSFPSLRQSRFQHLIAILRLLGWQCLRSRVKSMLDLSVGGPLGRAARTKSRRRVSSSLGPRRHRGIYGL